MGNVLRIVVGLAGLIGAGWSAVRTLRARKHERLAGVEATDRTSFGQAFAILGAAAVGIALTLLL